MALMDLLARLGVGVLACTPGGPPLGGGGEVACLDAPDLPSALLVAEAEGTMGGGLGAVLDGDVLTLVSRPVTAAARPTPVSTSADVVAEVAEARRRGLGVIAVRLGFDPAAPPQPLVPSAGAVLPASAASSAAGGASADHPGVPRLWADPGLAARFPAGAGAVSSDDAGAVPPVDLILAGRGVIRSGAVEQLRAFAERTGLGVLNTFTAKGLFRWDSPFHLGTGGLQELDLALAGASGSGLVVAVGLDADEWPTDLLRAAGVRLDQILELAPEELMGAPAALRPRGGAGVQAGGERPRLYRELAAVVQPLYQQTAAPLNPARAAADIAEMLPDGAAVWTQPGHAALWVARALPTTRLGSVRVPPVGSAGVALAGALGAASRPGGSAVAVVDALPTTGVAGTLLDRAAGAPGTIVVEIWGDGGDLRSAQEHRDRLAAALAKPGVHVIEVPVDFSATAELVGVAGPPLAWPGRLPG
ncbi:hypothetical protein ACG83_18925 [Frankia sp. R43]|uniref:hypothetical protein n=1 Tax=Frankia sp. R43 TaxID=269536 RepID=UPI0006C9F9C7|nr:hypothetical protein [Frankia sp. R43]KPM54103.1 hypothetical protein ACG83_18925 [Frankia sp. R43]